MYGKGGKIMADARRLKSAIEERRESSHGARLCVPQCRTSGLTIANDENHLDFCVEHCARVTFVPLCDARASSFFS